MQPEIKSKIKQKIPSATVRFTGDSGDGMQLVGGQFSQITGIAGNDVMTFPDFPAEIRAPQGTIAGVSGFQVHFGDHTIYTPGDKVDALIAMNPAAFKANLRDLKERGVLIANSDEFNEKNLSKVDYQTNPLDAEMLQQKYHVIQVPIPASTQRALAESGLSSKEIDRCKNFFALGITYWMYQRDVDKTKAWIDTQFAKKPHLASANKLVLDAGYSYAETTELFEVAYEITKAHFKPGTYRNITGNSALALGLVAATELADLPALYAGYPITPASDILHEIAKYKNYNIRTFQTEDEIAAIAAAVGASYGGSIGVTVSSGPGIALKSEAINLAVITELPVVIVDVQRAGPSTGMPTKNEQTDLLMALYGRNGESPVPVIAPSSASDCFYAAIEATRLAVQFMTPVFILSEGFLGNSSEPWQLPAVEDLEKIHVDKVKVGESRETYQAYGRNEKTLARRWAPPGVAGFEHRIGGLEKDDNGNISYDPDNHDRMVRLRQAKIDRIADFIPELKAYPENKGDLLVLGWGSTYGAIREAVERVRKVGHNVAHAHLKHLNPFPKNIEQVLKSFNKVLIPETNLGQLVLLIRGKYLIPAKSFNQVRGRPFGVDDLEAAILSTLKEK
ncbi:MAG TPA: 2-oxoacid:acceptor oxidoreductase subunit alpha [Turneriella sp.]|nr:2-oxoacid:acceptor oxidoreductase subunit alpha [Turneriella sp.]